MGQLQTDHQVVVPPEPVFVRLPHLRTDRSQGIGGVIGNEKLARIAPPGVHDRRSLGAVKKLRAAGSEVEPAAAGELARCPVRHAVPPLHRENRPAVADRASLAYGFPRKRGGTVRRHFRDKPDIDVFAFQIGRKILYSLEFSHLTISFRHVQNLFPFRRCTMMISVSSRVS